MGRWPCLAILRGSCMFSCRSTHKIRLKYRLSSLELKRLMTGRAPVLAGVPVVIQIVLSSEFHQACTPVGFFIVILSNQLKKSSVAHQACSAVLDFVWFCMDLIFSVGTVRFSSMKNRAKDTKNRTWSNTRIGRCAGGSVPGLNDTYYIHKYIWQLAHLHLLR